LKSHMRVSICPVKEKKGHEGRVRRGKQREMDKSALRWELQREGKQAGGNEKERIPRLKGGNFRQVKERRPGASNDRFKGAARRRRQGELACRKGKGLTSGGFGSAGVESTQRGGVTQRGGG